MTQRLWYYCGRRCSSWYHFLLAGATDSLIATSIFIVAVCIVIVVGLVAIAPSWCGNQPNLVSMDERFSIPPIFLPDFPAVIQFVSVVFNEMLRSCIQDEIYL